MKARTPYGETSTPITVETANSRLMCPYCNHNSGHPKNFKYISSRDRYIRIYLNRNQVSLCKKHANEFIEELQKSLTELNNEVS